MSIYSPSDQSSPHVQERGSLRTLGEGQSQFIGSSTGVYFVNTVRRAFADADAHLSSSRDSRGVHPSPEDCIVADEEDLRGGRLRSRDPSAASSRAPSVRPGAVLLSYGAGISLDLGRPPPRHVAMQLFMTYFRNWHPFFPFMHGPTVGQDIEKLYETLEARQSSGLTASTHKTPGEEPPPLPLPRVIILQCLFNLASLHSDVELPSTSRIDRPARILSHLLGFAAKGDIVSIQALFAAQLLLVARMSLRNAVVVAGLLSRAIFLAGLHRCPVRYVELSSEDCDIRKRLFWSIYVLDRFLSQALGHPLGIQDSDVDVCPLNKPELHHRNMATRLPSLDHISEETSTTNTSQANAQSRTTSTAGDRSDVDHSPSTVNSATEKKNRHQILAFQVEYSRLSGRALEIFHKSIHIRSIDPSVVLSLRTDLEAWWNSLPSELQDFCVHDEHESSTRPSVRQSQPFSVPALFILLHNQLRLSIYRPWLSLEPSTPEFRSALQVCIGASRDIILNVQKQHNADYGLFWPGYVSAIWMAGIILAFACRLELYPAPKGQREINICLDILSGLSKRWPLAKNCHSVLSDLQQIVQQSSESHKQHGRSASTSNSSSLNSQFQGRLYERHGDLERPAKRVRYDEANQQPQTPGPRSNTMPLSGTNDRLNNNDGYLIPPYTNETSSITPTGEPAISHLYSTPSTRPIPPFNQRQQQYEPLPTGTGTATNPSTTSGAGFGFSDPIQGNGSSGAPWTNLSDLSGWDSGMPDILHGVTWESLLQTVSEENIEWDGQVL